MTQHRDELKDFFDGMKPVQPTSIDDVFKTDFVRGTLVRISPKSGLEGIEVHPGEHLPPLFDYAKGIITALKREGGKLRIETDNEDLRLFVTEAKARFYPRPDGGIILHPGWNDCVVGYALYVPGPLPEHIAKEFR